jgi:hypothetical protein
MNSGNKIDLITRETPSSLTEISIFPPYHFPSLFFSRKPCCLFVNIIEIIRCCYIPVDFAMAASQKVVYITRQEVPSNDLDSQLLYDKRC